MILSYIKNRVRRSPVRVQFLIVLGLLCVVGSVSCKKKRVSSVITSDDSSRPSAFYTKAS